MDQNLRSPDSVILTHTLRLLQDFFTSIAQVARLTLLLQPTRTQWPSRKKEEADFNAMPTSEKHNGSCSAHERHPPPPTARTPPLGCGIKFPGRRLKGRIPVVLSA